VDWLPSSLRADVKVGQVSCLVFSPNSRVVASGSRDHTVRLWDAYSGTLLRELKDEPVLTDLSDSEFGSILDFVFLQKGAVTALAFSPDGSLLASGGPGDGIIRLWNTDPRLDRARARVKAFVERERV
jgi:WD40 repeat protein